ncbi:MAG TPA: DUF1080 domain-containing protein [Hyphomonadaceae bacterium]|nr:DUF1080 domain-containing protein [Hyphomonadaceae bacterium]
MSKRLVGLMIAGAVALALGAAACSNMATATSPTAEAGPNTLSLQEKQAGWQLLFNGKDFNGWHFYRGGQVTTPWSVQDGTIALAGPGTDIITNDEFGDFDLSLEWKISPAGNSGIIYMVKEDASAPQTYNTGPEMQVLDNAGHADGKIPSHRAGALYDLVTPPDNVTKPVGEWNLARVRVYHGKIEHWLNGVKTAESSYGDAAWFKMVAGSKFKDMPLFGKAKVGHIALQDHGDKVWYRNIKIKRLSV